MKFVTVFLLFCSIVFASDDLLQAGEIAPGFFLRDSDNKNFFMSKYVGVKAKPNLKGPLVISFFASWCIPCRTEIPFLTEMQKEYPAVKFYLINVSEDKKTVHSYIKKIGITLPVLLDQFGVTAKKYKVADAQNNAKLPGLFIINGDGIIKYSHQGFDESSKEHIIGILDSLLIKK